MPSSLRGAMLRLTPGPGVPGAGARRGRGRPLLCKLLLLLLLESVYSPLWGIGAPGRLHGTHPMEGKPEPQQGAPALGCPHSFPTAAVG